MKVAAILAAVGLLLTYFIVSEQRRSARLTSQATGTITKVTLDKDEESSSLDQTLLEYEFVVGGNRIASSDSLPGDKTADFRTGQAVTLCYDPAEPTETNVLTRAGERCGS
jgi:hypothetical protein